MLPLAPSGPWIPYNNGVPYTSPLQTVYRYQAGTDLDDERLRGFTGTHPGTDNYAYYGTTSTGFFVAWSHTDQSTALSELYRPGGYPESADYWNYDPLPSGTIGWQIEARGEISPPWLEESLCDDLGLSAAYEEWFGPDGEGESRFWAWQDTHWTDATNLQFYYDNNSTFYFPGDPWTGTVGPVHAADVHVQYTYRNGDAGVIGPQTNPIVVLNPGFTSVVGTNFSPPMARFDKFYVNVAPSDAFDIAGWGTVMAAGYVMQPDWTSDPDINIGYYRGLGRAQGLIIPNSFQWLTLGQVIGPAAPRDASRAGLGPDRMIFDYPGGV